MKMWVAKAVSCARSCLSDERSNDPASPYDEASALYNRRRYAEARRLYEALTENDAYARTFLAWMHEQGEGAPPDLQGARALYESVGATDCMYARFQVGKFYQRDGQPERGFAIMVELTNKGYLPAIYWRGRMLAEGEGCSKDEEQGRYYLEYAAGHGHVWAAQYFIKRQLRSNNWVTRIRGVRELIRNVRQGYRLHLRNDSDSRLIA